MPRIVVSSWGRVWGSPTAGSDGTCYPPPGGSKSRLLKRSVLLRFGPKKILVKVLSSTFEILALLYTSPPGENTPQKFPPLAQNLDGGWTNFFSKKMRLDLLFKTKKKSDIFSCLDQKIEHFYWSRILPDFYPLRKSILSLFY